jgi:hypothetical protein
VDNNFFRNSAENRATGLALAAECTSATHSNYIIEDNNLSNNDYGINRPGPVYTDHITVRRNSARNNATFGMYFGGDYQNFSNNDFSDSATGLKTYGSHILIQDNNLSKSGTKGGYGLFFTNCNGTMTDNNFLRNTAGNRLTGIFLYGDCTSSTDNYITIADSNLIGNDYGVSRGGSGLTVNYLTMLRNRVSNSATRSVSINGTGHVMNYNNFITNAAPVQGGTFLDANYNYWSDWNGTACNCGGTYCANPRAFTGGADNSPYCNPIS